MGIKPYGGEVVTDYAKRKARRETREVQEAQRGELRGIKGVGERPPRYRPATMLGANCKTCRFDGNGRCLRYPADIDPQHVCDDWTA